MNLDQHTETLDGKLLIAMPGMSDPRFEKSVILLCSHDSEGAMGLIINKPASEVSFEHLIDQLKIPASGQGGDVNVHFGGPVEIGRGFILHSTDYEANTSTLSVGGDYGMTATLDILEDIANGRGPEQAILALGYSGWAPGQLESEILSNGWLTCDADTDLVFRQPNDAKWEAALKSLGIDALTLSPTSGRA